MKQMYFRWIATMLYVLLNSSTGLSQNASDIERSYVILNVNGAGNIYYDLNDDSPLNPDFSGSLGTFTSSNSLVLNGAQNQTYKCGTHNIMNGFVDYRIYLATNPTPPAFIPSEILYNTNNPTSNHCGGTSTDQTWESMAANIDILAGLPSGDYILELYTRADADYDGNDIVDNTYYISDNGNNYAMSFRVDNPPTASCISNLTVYLDATGNATINATDINSGSTDDFDTPTLSIDVDSFDCSDIGTPVIVTLTVEDSLGQTDTCSATVTVEDAAITANASVNIAVSDAAICEGENVIFTATPTNSGATNYTWHVEGNSFGPIPGTTDTFDPTILMTMTPGNYEVYVTMQSNLSNCNVPIESNHIILQINPLPSVSAPASVCMGSTDTLSPTSGGTWVSNNPAIATVDNAGVITPVASGMVTFTFTNTTTGCSNTTTAVTINTLPVLTAPATLCENETAFLTPTTGGTWTSNNSSVASVNSSTGEITGVAPGNVTFTFTNASGCQNTTSAVEVLESPVITSVTASNDPVCAGDSSILSVSVQGSVAAPEVIVNYDFESGNNYNQLVNSSTVPNINSTFYTGTGANNIPFNTFNPWGNRHLMQMDDWRDGGLGIGGSDDSGYWGLDVSGSGLSNYQDLRISFEWLRAVRFGTDKTIRVQYRVGSSGGWTSTDIPVPSNNATYTNNWQTVNIPLPASFNNQSLIQFRLVLDDGSTYNTCTFVDILFGNCPDGAKDISEPHVYIDNLQIQGATVGGGFEYSWSANTGANAGLPTSATIPSTGNSQITVNPQVTTEYTVTTTNGDGCPSTETVTVNVFPSPEIIINADYCPADLPGTPENEANMVQLVASANQPITNWEWNTGETGNTIYVDIAGTYQVIGTTANGCSGGATIGVAQELVVNGNFEQGNVGFTSDYAYHADVPGLVPAGQGELYNDSGNNGYSITTNGQNVHTNFWGYDHTSGSGNFMAVNGHGNTLVVWKQHNIPVLPNTTYYFSAWGMSLNNSAQRAQLTFNVNGVNVGTTASLPTHPNNNNPGSDNWTRFYGTWNSGSNTSVDIEIRNLNNALNGNDFGIDDISFATLSTFIRLTSAIGTDGQTICQDTPIADISYDVGGGLTAPEINWYLNGSPTSMGANVFPDGLGYTFNGLSYGISGTPTVPGNYTYTLQTTSSCDIKSVNGSLTVEAAPTVTMNAATSPICHSEGYVTVSATFGGSATTGTWSGGTNNFQNVTTTGNTVTAEYHFGANETGNVILTFTSDVLTGSLCDAASESVTIDITPYAIANAGTDIDYSSQACDNLTVALAANNVSGEWTVLSGQPIGSYQFSNANQYNSQFTGESGETYVLQWEAFNALPCGNTNDTVTVTFADCGTNLVFDGTNDYINCSDNYNATSNFSMEAWIKADVLSGTKTILSKRDQTSMTHGFDLRTSGSNLNFRWNGNSLVAPQPLSTNKWYHVAVTYDGSRYRLYIDGFLATNATGSLPTANSNKFLIGAMDRNNNTPVNYFDGAIDEVRLWNVALTQTQIQDMMNQEIQANGNNVRGVVIPMDINGLQWSNFRAYYQMATGPQTILSGGDVNDVSTNGVSGKTVNMTSVQSETAPIPYVTRANANWDNNAAWLNGTVQQIPNSSVNSITGVAQTWNIVRIQHNISSGNRATEVSGLLVDSNKYSINNNQRLDVTKYLKIDGVLDLVGESQLLQPDGSYVDQTGTGHLEIDQQGTTNGFNYNYWGSPVSSAVNTFSIADVLWDGTNANNPMPLQWTNSNNSSATSPLTMSRRWLYLYENYPQESYADWNAINENYDINIGLGFTMKGSNAGGTLQNYTFVGTPNNGLITTPITVGNQALIGNPYPSAIDSHEFIRDNIAGAHSNTGTTQSIDGTLYFWEQSPTNASHTLNEYEGGYASLNLSGALPAIAPSEIEGVGSAGKLPKRYIPVGQGFYVTASATAGNIQFKNSQRFFVKESSGNSEFFRSSQSTDEDIIKRVRLRFKTPQGGIRPLMLAFTGENAATDGFDYGYDAENTDFLSNDMSFMIENKKYVIQGVGEFDTAKQYPLGIFLSNTGQIDIALTELENFDDTIDVYLYDSLLGTYHQINDTSYAIQLEAGDYLDRFYIAFETDNTLEIIDQVLQNTVVNYLQSTDEIYIKVSGSTNVKQVYLINMIGQTVKSWNSTNMTLNSEMRIPVSHVSEGNYIVQVQTDTGNINRKIIIKF